MDRPESKPPSGLTAEGESLFATAFSSAAKKDDDWWIRAEHQTAELITSIQPIRFSEERRIAIANFVERLIKGCLDCFVQVETFGSVPLKTYLPDGDIDLTALSVHTDLKETWAQDVVKALKRAEEDADAEFRVKEVQYIQAEVKIIKCLVENIVVDISFNQTGGLNTFLFLEKVDRYIGQNHLFKRSIILVKAWCYYESRILGAHHGLISTYALETLVLYIFHVFHPSLRGPLEVLYTFLVYFSNFDWDKYCVSLWGPLPLAQITQGISVDFAESPRNDGVRLLLPKEFLERCIKDHSGASIGQDSNQGRYFNTKYLNVLDPIRDTNNLGRSVNVGSFKRIRSAFGLGARTLGEVLECSQVQINEKFKSFFSCTFKSLERYRSGGRPDTASDIKQERVRATEASLAQPTSGNLNVVNPEGQWRQVGGKGRYTNAEGDLARVKIKGSSHYIPLEHFERSMPVNRRSGEEHEHANHPLFRSPLAVEYQSRAPSQDSPGWGPSRGDLIGQGGASRSRNVSDPNLSLSNLDVGRPPGPSGDFKTNPSHGSFNRKVASGDENDTSASGRKIAPAEQRKGQWSAQQRVYTSPGDISYQGSSQDSGSQGMLRPWSSPKYIPPYLQLHPHGYLAQMHLPVSSAMPVPASSLAGPPSASSVHATHHSASPGESFPSRTNSYLSMQEPRILPSAVAATSSLMIPVAPSGEGATSHNAGFSVHAEDRREHRRSPLEDQKQPLHRTSVTSNASPGLSFPVGSTSLSESCPSPYSAAPTVLPELVLGKSKPTRGGPSPPFETGEFPQAYGPIGGSLSRLSMSDERSGEASRQLEERADSWVLETRNKENRPHNSDVKGSDGMRAKVTNGVEQLSRSQSYSDECELEVVRSVDGHAAELRRHWLSQPSLEETSVGGRQGAALHVPSFPSPPHSYQEMLPTSLPSYRKSSAILSGTLEPAVSIPGQSLLVPTHQAGAGTDLIPSFTSERQVLPTSVGVSGGPSGDLHPPIIEHAPVSTGPFFRNQPLETTSLLVTLPPPMYYTSSPQMPAYSPYFFMPTATGGVIMGDSMGDLHSNGSMDSGTNILGSQALQDARAGTNPQVGMSVAERPKGAGAVMSPSNKMETSHVERINEEDILFGDLKDQKESLLRLFEDYYMLNSDPNFASTFLEGPQLWEGLGRLKGNLNPHVGLNISHPPGVAGPSYSLRGRVPDGMPQPRGFSFHCNEDTLPKSRVGTGTYLPNPRHTHVNRERPGPGGRGGNQHGSYGHQDRTNLEENYQSHAPRYRSAGQGQGQQNKHEPRAQMMTNAQKNPASDPDRESTIPQQQIMEKRAQPPVSSLPPPSTQTTSTGLHIASSNGYPGVGTNAPPIIMQQFVNDGSAGFSPELEFGSLGPFQPG